MKASIIPIVLSTAGLAIGFPTEDVTKRASSFECMSMSPDCIYKTDSRIQ